MTIGDLGSSIWETANLPEEYKNKGYQTSTVHVPPAFAGVSNGVTEEVLGLQQLVKLGYDVATKEDVRTGIWDGITNITFNSVIDAGDEAIRNKVNQYSNHIEKPSIAQHALGKDTVQAATALVGIGVITKSGKLAEGVADVGKQVSKQASQKLSKNAKELFEYIKKYRKNARKVLETIEGKNYAKKYFDKFVKDGDFEKWYNDVFKKYEKGEPLNFEVHHVIPIGILEKNKKFQDLLFWAEQNGMKLDFNGVDNGIPLPKKSIKHDISGHANHPKYDRVMNKKVNEILEDLDLTDMGKFDEIQSLINKTKGRLEAEVLLGNIDVNQLFN